MIGRIVDMRKQNSAVMLMLSVTAVVAAALAVLVVAAGCTGNAGRHTGWELATNDPMADYHPAFTGNGYLGVRVPGVGAGYATEPITTQFQIAGFFAQPAGQVARKASLPAWSGLDLSDGSDNLSDALAAPCRFGQTCEAEFATVSAPARSSTGQTGFTGTAFVTGYGADAQPLLGAATSWTVSDVPADGSTTLTVRYANGKPDVGDPKPHTVSLYVNDVRTGQLTLPPTTSWSTWGSMQQKLALRKGSNTVALRCDQGDSCQVNLDNAAFTTPGTQPPAPQPPRLAETQLRDYRQTLHLRTGTLVTESTWLAGPGRSAKVRYEVTPNRARRNVATIRLNFTPDWTGEATLTDVIDGQAADWTTDPHTGHAADASQIWSEVTAIGTGLRAAVASQLEPPAGAGQPQAVPGAGATIRQRVTVDVTAGSTYTATKYVGVATSHDDPQPVGLVRRAAQDAAQAGYAGLSKENANAWEQAWQGDIEVSGSPPLQAQLRASLFSLYASVRAGSPWSPSPGGLSSDGYNGHVFWDSETWMYPGLLALHPDIARSMLQYRVDRLEAAFRYARETGYRGARFPWESALSGLEDTPTWAKSGPNEQHISSDIALAAWQYWLVSGDLEWFRGKGYPLLRGIADFWLSRVTRNGDGSYSINGVMPPDEYHENVDDSVYTNVAARQALRFAIEAARLVGEQNDPQWTVVADGLRIPFDPATGVHPEFLGYTGDLIKQADVVMLRYPWENPQPTASTRADLSYYAPRTDPHGPAMTDSVHSIVSSELGDPGCAAFTYTRRSVDPFMRAPFLQYSEARTGGAFTFVTGAGGFVQEFTHGYSGLRWRSDRIALDPSLPPQLEQVRLRGLHWQGRVFDVTVGSESTTLRLTTGPAMPVDVAGQQRVVQSGQVLELPTRRPDRAPGGDLARCRPVTASVLDPSYPAEAAVDGSDATSWLVSGAKATLTMDLGKADRLGVLATRWDGVRPASYTVSVSVDGTNWREVATAPGSSDRVDLRGEQARQVRLTVDGAHARLATVRIDRATE